MKAEGMTEREEKHMALIQSVRAVESAVQQVWELLYRIDPGQKPPPSPEKVESQERFSLSESLAMSPELLRTHAGSLRECTAAIESTLF